MGQCHKHVSLLTGAVILAAFSVLLFTFIFLSMFYSPFKYAIGIDAGSSHSEIILYRWKVDKFNNTGLVEQIDKCDIDEGLASLTPDNLVVGLHQFRRCLNELYDHVPLSINRKEINIYLGATAGARMLQLKNSAWMEHLFSLLRELFNQEGFHAEKVGIIQGSEEGLYAWISVNYLTQKFFSSLIGWDRSYSILDQGGASAQVAQVVSKKDAAEKAQDIVNVTLYGNDYSVYTFSNLCFGSNEWFQRYLTILLRKAKISRVEAACLPRDYVLEQGYHTPDTVCSEDLAGGTYSKPHYSFIGTGNYDNCTKEIQSLIDPNECRKTFRFCPKVSEHRPKSSNLYAMSTYYYVMKGLNMNEKKLTKKEFVTRVKDICGMGLTQVKDHIDTQQKYLPFFCAKSVYILESLENIYKLEEEDWSKLRFTNKIGQHSLGWLMGFIISATNNIPARTINQMFMISWSVYALLFVLFGLLTVALLYHARTAQLQLIHNRRRSHRSDDTELKYVSPKSSPNHNSESI